MQQKLGVILEKEDEMECLVGGCNFLLKAIRHEAFTYENGALNFVTNTGEPMSAAVSIDAIRSPACKQIMEPADPHSEGFSLHKP